MGRLTVPPGGTPAGACAASSPGPGGENSIGVQEAA